MRNRFLEHLSLVALAALLPGVVPSPAAAQTAYHWSDFVGGNSRPGATDGTGSAARFYVPRGVAVDGQGNVYVADTWNGTIRKATPGGVVTTLAGSAGSLWEFADGTGSGARFWMPFGAAVDASGNVYVADAHSIRKVTPAGVVTTLAGPVGMDEGGGFADGTGPDAQFNRPSGVAVDGAGNVYVADWMNHAIRKVTPGGVVTTLAGTGWSGGSADGTGSAAQFLGPTGVAVDGSGNLYVADRGNHTIRKVTPGGVVTTLAGRAGSKGSADGTGSAARFSSPWGIAVDGEGNVYVADSMNHTIRKVTPDGAVTTIGGIAGQLGGSNGAGSDAQFMEPSGVAVDSAGNLYVADTGNSIIRKGTTGAGPAVQKPKRFPATEVGKKSRTQTLRITNRSGLSLTRLRVAAKGSARKDFVFKQPARKILKPGAATTFKATFRPKAKGVRRAKLTVSSSARPVTAPLSGRGKARKVRAPR